MPVKFSKYNRKLTEIVTHCEFDFRLNFALNGGRLGHNLQTCECFIFIVCIIRPLNIDKKSKLKCFISSFFSQIGLRNLTDSHLGRHLEYFKTLNDARVASVGFIKYSASTTRINKEKNFKIKFQVILFFFQFQPSE